MFTCILISIYDFLQDKVITADVYLDVCFRLCVNMMSKPKLMTLNCNASGETNPEHQPSPCRLYTETFIFNHYFISSLNQQSTQEKVQHFFAHYSFASTKISCWTSATWRWTEYRLVSPPAPDDSHRRSQYHLVSRPALHRAGG